MAYCICSHRNREKQKAESEASEATTTPPLAEVSGTEALIEDVTVPTDPANIFSNASGRPKRMTILTLLMSNFLFNRSVLKVIMC